MFTRHALDVVELVGVDPAHDRQLASELLAGALDLGLITFGVDLDHRELARMQLELLRVIEHQISHRLDR